MRSIPPTADRTLRLVARFAAVGLLLLSHDEPLPLAPGTWEPVGPDGGSIRDIDRHPTDPQEILAVAGWSGAGVFRTRDGGRSWQPINDGLDLATYDNPQVLEQDPDRPERLFAGLGRNAGRLYRSLDGGTTWSPAHAETGIIKAIAIDPSNTDRILFGTLSSELRLSEDGGVTFTDVAPADLPPVWSLLFDPFDARYVYCGTSDGLWRSDDGGRTWSDLGSTADLVRWISADRIQSGRIYLSTRSPYGLWRSDDRGQTLVDIRGDLSPRAFSNIAPDPAVADRLWVGGRGGMFLTVDGGAHWEPRTNGLDSDIRDEPDYVNYVAVDPDDGTHLWAGADFGLFESHDLGGSWSKIGLPSHDVLQLSADPLDPAEVQVGTAFGLYHPRTGGGYAPGRQCVADSGFRVHALETGGNGWIWDGTDTSFYDALLVRTLDGCRADGTSESVLFVPEGDSVTAVGIGPAASDVVLAAVGRASAAGARIFRSTQGGAADTFVPLPGTALFAILADFAWDPVDPLHVLAVSQDGDIYESLDAGASWTSIRTFNGPRHYRIVIQPSDPLTVYVATAEGIDRSVDGGATFSPYALTGEDVTGLDIPVNDPEAMFASARGTGVFRSHDRGQQWELLDSGLYHLELRDIEFRPESDLLFAGTRGGGVYRLASAGYRGPDLDLDGIPDAHDNCPADANADQRNADGDPAGDICDCAPTDPDAYRVPREVTGLRLARTGATTSLNWDDPRPPAGPGTTSDLLDGDLAALRDTGGFDASRCPATGLVEPAWDDTRPPPPAGSGLYYLVRAVNVCGRGTFGDSTLGGDPRDALDLASPCD